MIIMNRKYLLLAAALLLSSWAGELSAATKAGARRPSPLADSMRQVRKTPALAAREAFREFSRKQGKGWNVRYNPRTALPEALTGGRTARYPGSPEQAAIAFFEENKGFLKVEPSALRLVLNKEFAGITHLQYQQYKDGIPVEFSYARVHVAANGQVSGYQGKFEPEVNLNTTPALTAEAAVQAAAADLGRQLSVTRAELVIYPDENDGALKLAWKLRGRGNGLWVYYINAADGGVLLKYDDLRRYCDNNAYTTYGTSSGTVYAISPLPVYDGLSVTKTEDLWVQPAKVSLRDQYVWVRDYSSMTVTNASGDYCAQNSGKMYSSLKGPYFAVTNFRNASAHYDNGGGVWNQATTLVQTPHPYSNSPSFSYTQAYPYSITIPDTWSAKNYTFAKAMPRFTDFHAGELDNNGNVNDADQVYVKDGDAVLGAYIGTRTSPFFGAAVEKPSFGVTLEADSVGTAYGFNIDKSYYLVLTTAPTASVNPGNVIWSTASVPIAWSTAPTGVYMDRTLGDANALSEVNAFYHLNKARRFFDPINIKTSGGVAADLTKQVAVMVHAAGDPDSMTTCSVSCHGMLNAYYDLEKDYIVIGDGQMDYNNIYRSFALDGTIVRHEYMHLVMARIYPIINLGEFGALSEAVADYLAMASFWREGYATQKTLGNFVGAGEGAARDISASGNPTGLRKMPVSDTDPLYSWYGEVHDDSLILSQALYRLGNPSGSNYLGTFTAGTFSGQSKADVLTYAALFYFPDNFSNFYEAMLDACAQFDTQWGGECDAGAVASIGAAFDYQGIGVARGEDSYDIAAYSGLCKNNNGPECATDVSSFTALSATVSPVGDVDYYSLPLSAGNFTAKLDLPGITGQEGVYFAYSMFLFDSNRGLALDSAGNGVIAVPDIYGSGSDYCPDSGQCKTLAPSVILNYSVPVGDRYYLVVAGAPNQYYGNSEVNSPLPYTLTLTHAPQGTASARFTAAVFDNDEIAFEVPYTKFSMVGSVSSAPVIDTPPGAELLYEYAQLRDYKFEPLAKTRTDLAGTYMQKVANSLNYNNSDALGRPLLSGRVKVLPGYAQAYPWTGTVYLEIFGRNHLGQVLSLGVSNPINLTSGGSDSTVAYNNIIGSGFHDKAIIHYVASSAGPVTIKIYTQTGTLVKTIPSFPSCGATCSGEESWDGRNSDNGKAASGIYFVKVKGPGLDKIVKVAVIR